MNANEFDKWAREYDDSIVSSLNSFPFIGYFDVLNQVQKLADPFNDMKIMDVGIGTGLLSAYFVTQGCSIYGVDFSEEMVQLANGKIPNGRFDIVDVNENHFGKFNGEKFDCIISSYWIHHLDNHQKLRFLKRCVDENLNSGGKIIIADIGFANPADFKIARKIHQEKWDSSEHYLCGAELIQLLKEVGLNVKYFQISECAGVLLYSHI